MGIYQWIRGLLLTMVVIILCRVVLRGLGYEDLSSYLGYAALAVIALGAVITLIGIVVESDTR